MAKKVDYTNLLLTSVVTALTYAFVNRLLSGKPKTGMSAALMVFANLPTRDQARFADGVTYENAKNPKWLVEQTANVDPEDPKTYKNINRTSIANCAFISLYGTHKESREKCQRILQNLKSQWI